MGEQEEEQQNEGIKSMRQTGQNPKFSKNFQQNLKKG
jgi:hypothetical protein